VSRLHAGQSGIQVLARARDFSLSQNIQTGSGAHPVSCSVDFGGLFPQEIKRPEHEADNRPVSSTKVMNEWSCTFTPPICLYSMYVYSFTCFTSITVTIIISANKIDWLVCVEGMQCIFCAIAAGSINLDKLKAS